MSFAFSCLTIPKRKFFHWLGLFKSNRPEIKPGWLRPSLKLSINIRPELKHQIIWGSFAVLTKDKGISWGILIPQKDVQSNFPHNHKLCFLSRRRIYMWKFDIQCKFITQIPPLLAQTPYPNITYKLGSLEIWHINNFLRNQIFNWAQYY